MKERHRSIRIFENPYLERLTHVHPIIPLILWAPVIGYFYGHAYGALNISFSRIVALSLLGLLSWTFLEYVLHRFLFHMPITSAFQKRFQFIVHGLHHEDPQDPTRLVMPPAAGIILATILFLSFRMVLGPIYVEPFFASFLLGYLCYDYTHFYVHHYTPKSVIGRKIRSHHLKHHFATPDARWGVSSPLWDFVFGTMGPQEVKKAANQGRGVTVEESTAVIMPSVSSENNQQELIS